MPRSQPRQHPSRRPTFERLEDRTVPAIAVGSPFPVNVTTRAIADTVRSAAAPDGRFVAVWAQTQRAGDPNPTFLRAQRFSAAGQRVGAEIVVSGARPINFNNGLDVAMDRQGNFVVVWSQRSASDYSNIYARRYSASGQLRGLTMTVAARAGVERNPQAAMDAAGNFVITYQAAYGTAARYFVDLYGARYLGDGRPYKPFTIYASKRTPSVFVSSSDMGMAPDGRFSVAYSLADTNADEEKSSLIVKNYDRLANFKVTEPLFANARVGVRAKIAVDDRANAVVAWDRLTLDPNLFDLISHGIYAVRVNSTGGHSGGIVIDNSSGILHSVALNRVGNTFAVAWGNQADIGASISYNLKLTEVTTRNVPQAPLAIDGNAPTRPHLGASLGTRGNGRFFLAYLVSPDSSYDDADVFGRLGTY